MSAQTVAILGGGVGGLVAANELACRLPPGHRIVVVEKAAIHAFAPLGAELAPEAIPGLAEAAHTFYTLEGAEQLRSALANFTDGTVAVVVSATPYKCPGAPHEGAMLLADFFRRRGLRGAVELHLFTPEPQPMPVAGPQLGEAVQDMLASRGIAFHPLHKLTTVDPAARELTFAGKPAVKYDLLVADGYCMLEAGEDLAGFAFGDFFAEPAPAVPLRRIGRSWHLGKLLFERWWLAPFGLRRRALGLALELGARAHGVPLAL